MDSRLKSHSAKLTEESRWQKQQRSLVSDSTGPSLWEQKPYIQPQYSTAPNTHVGKALQPTMHATMETNSTHANYCFLHLCWPMQYSCSDSNEWTCHEKEGRIGLVIDPA